MPVEVSSVCPSCGGGLSYGESDRIVRCPSCDGTFSSGATARRPACFISNAIEPGRAVGSARAALKASGAPYTSVRDALLLHIPFCRQTASKMYWEVHDIARGPDGARVMEPRPLLGYGEDVVKGLLVGGGQDSSDRKLELAEKRVESLRPMLGLEGVTLAPPPPDEVVTLPDSGHGEGVGMLVSPEDVCNTPRPKDVPNLEATHSSVSYTVYAPYWVVETAPVGGSGGGSLVFVDGTSGEAVSTDAPLAYLDRLVGKPPERPDTGPLSPSACASCGGGMVGSSGDAVLFCSSCGVAWGPGGKVPYTVLAPKSEAGPEVAYLPVWAVHARLVSPERVVDSRFDLLRLAPGMNWPTEEDKDLPMMFFMPAFGLDNLKMFARASAAMTRLQPVIAGSSPGDAIPSRGCRLGPDDALRVSTLMLYALIPKGNKAAADFALSADVEPVEARLVIVPFARTKFDYRDTVTGVSIPASAFAE